MSHQEDWEQLWGEWYANDSTKAELNEELVKVKMRARAEGLTLRRPAAPRPTPVE